MAVSLNRNFGILNGPGALVSTPKLCQKPFLNVFLPYTKTEISNVDTKSWANPVRKSENVTGGVNRNFGIFHGPDTLVTTPKHCQTHIEVEKISNFDPKSWANPLALRQALSPLRHPCSPSSSHPSHHQTPFLVSFLPNTTRRRNSKS